jgi:hypothetical protein
MTGDGDCGEIGGMKIGKENRSLGENLPQRHFVHDKSDMARPGFEPGPQRWEASDYCIVLYLVCEATGTAASPGLLCQHRVLVEMIVEKQMECRLARETEVLG